MDLVYDLPHCPSNFLPTIDSPSSILLFIICGVFGAAFAGTIGFQYNSVELPHINRKIRTSNISNNVWIAYFVISLLRAVCDSVRFGLHGGSELAQEATGILSTIMRGMTSLFLGVALNYQKKHRSGEVPPELQPFYRSSPDSVRSKFSKVFWTMEALLGFLCVLFVAMTWVYAEIPSPITEWVFFSTSILQHIPILYLVLHVSFSRRNLDAGPTRKSKIILMLATILYIPCDVPLKLWVEINSGDMGCLLTFASLADCIILLHLISLILYFVFMRAEYKRNQEECLFTVVSQSQDFFDFRKF